MDFLGLFALWGVMTIVCLIAHVMMAWYHRRSKRNKTGSSEEEKGDDIATIAPDLNINDTSAMLRLNSAFLCDPRGQFDVLKGLGHVARTEGVVGARGLFSGLLRWNARILLTLAPPWPVLASPGWAAPLSERRHDKTKLRRRSNRSSIS